MKKGMFSVLELLRFYALRLMVMMMGIMVGTAIIHCKTGVDRFVNFGDDYWPF